MSIAISNYNNNIFDVVEYIKKLRNAGVSQEVAEIQGQEIEHVISNVLQQTKQDSKSLFESKELVTKGDLRESELRLQKEISELKYLTLKFVIWTGTGVTVVILGGVFTMLKVMLHI